MAPASRVVVVSGASGLIGRALVPALGAAGYTVVRLVREREAGPGELRWQPEAGALDLTAAHPEGVHAVIHLAGENIGEGRWSEARKRSILESRVQGTRTIVNAMKALATPPAALVSASGVGYYGGTRGDVELDESAPAGDDFPAVVCRAWEAETEPAAAAGIRVVRMRTGVVLTPEGGALQRLLTPFKLGLGGKVGGGRQWMSWVTMADTIAAYLFALARPIHGPVNLVAPGAVTQAELAKTLARVLGRPSLVPLPGFAVKMMFGEMGDALLLGGQRAAPRRLLAEGFAFAHPELEPALRAVLGKRA